MVKVPPPIWALIYLLIAAAIGWALDWPDTDDLRDLPLGVVLFVLGLIPPVWAIALFRKAGAEIKPDSATNKALVIAGPYRFARNPMYLGLVIVTLGIAFLVGAWPMLAAPVALFLATQFVHIPFEEAKMRRQFGAEYDAYTGGVRRRA